jgi:hypothetical protein
VNNNAFLILIIVMKIKASDPAAFQTAVDVAFGQSQAT